jgi:hypothetical protein
MSTVATIIVAIQNDHLDDGVVRVGVEALDFSAEADAHGLVFPPTSDTTAIVGAGEITRTIVADMTQTFMDSYPNDADRISALSEWIDGSLQLRGNRPFSGEVSVESIILS